MWRSLDRDRSSSGFDVSGFFFKTSSRYKTARWVWYFSFCWHKKEVINHKGNWLSIFLRRCLGIRQRDGCGISRSVDKRRKSYKSNWLSNFLRHHRGIRQRNGCGISRSVDKRWRSYKPQRELTRYCFKTSSRFKTAKWVWYFSFCRQQQEQNRISCWKLLVNQKFLQYNCCKK